MSRMTLYDKQAFAILKSLYNTLTGREVTVADYGNYINVFEKLRDFYKSDVDFQNAVYGDIFAKVGAVVWEDKKAIGDPFAFVQRSYDNILEFMNRGYIFSRPIETTTYNDKYFLANKEADGITPAESEQLTKWEQMRWKGKDYPTEVRGTTGKASFRDYINYYRRWIMDAMTEPYQFYNMWAHIKKEWLRNWDNYKKQWNRITFYNLVFGTTQNAGAEPRTVKLLTEYNQKYGKNLTKADWFKPGNVEEFAPFAYIRINEIFRLFGYESNMFMIDNKTLFRGKEYEYVYACDNVADAFIREPFLLMKSYANAQAFNETDLEKVSANYVDFWENPKDKYTIATSSYPYYNATTGKWETAEAEEPVTLDNLLGIIYDADAIGSSTYNERHYDTGLNEVTEHGVLHVHCDATNYYNPMLKACAILLE